MIEAHHLGFEGGGVEGFAHGGVEGSSNPVTMTDNGGGSYTLTMPAADVTISAN